MPRIVPLQLLKCLKVLLDDNGGILSESEVKRIAGLMTKYSKKLVSKCIYVQILKCTKTELLGEFMGAGGWTLVHMWLNDAIRAMNWPLVQEILELLLLCPVDVDRLKSNSAPKLVRGLCKDGGIEGVRILAKRLVEQWLKVVTADSSVSSAGTAPKIPLVVNTSIPEPSPATTTAAVPTMPPQTVVTTATQPLIAETATPVAVAPSTKAVPAASPIKVSSPSASPIKDVAPILSSRKVSSAVPTTTTAKVAPTVQTTKQQDTKKSAATSPKINKLKPSPKSAKQKVNAALRKKTPFDSDESSEAEEEQDPLAIIPNEVPIPSYGLTPAQKKASEAGLVYKIMVKDGQQVLTKVETAVAATTSASDVKKQQTQPKATAELVETVDLDDDDDEDEEEDEQMEVDSIGAEEEDEPEQVPELTRTQNDEVDSDIQIVSDEAEKKIAKPKRDSSSESSEEEITPDINKNAKGNKRIEIPASIKDVKSEVKEKIENKLERKSSKDSKDGVREKEKEKEKEKNKEKLKEKEREKDKDKEREKEKEKESDKDKDKERKTEKEKDRKNSSSSSHKSSSSSSQKSSSKSLSSSSSKSSSSSHRSSSDKHHHRSSSDKDKDKERSSSNKEKDRSSSSGSSSKHKSSSSSSSKNNSSNSSSSSSKERHRDKDKEKEKSISDLSKKEKETLQSEKDKDNLTNITKQTIIEKLGKISKKQKESIDSEDSNSSGATKSTSITIPSKKASMSIEIRRDSEKTKTVKTYKSQFRSHGLTEEAPPPPSRKGLKKPPSSTTPGTAIPLSLPSSLKRASPPPARDSPTDAKKSKLDINNISNVGTEKPGAIKLIAPKKIQTLVETNIFSDALSAATGPKKNTKRKRPASKDGATTPTSPEAAPKVAPLKFYQDTMDEDDKSSAGSDRKSEDETKENKDSKAETSSASAVADNLSNIDDDDDIPLKKVKEDIEQKVLKEQKANSGSSEDAEISNDVNDTEKTKADGSDTPPECTTPEPKPPGPGCGPNGPPGVLMLHRRKGPKKKLTWRSEDQLEQIRYFELDETERVNVTKTFMDMKNMERFSERDAINMSRRGFNHEDNMEPQTPWKALIMVDEVPPHPDGNQSKERKVQGDREQTTLRALYFSHAMIPDNPTEAELEPHYAHDIPVIPLDDITGNPDAVNDFTSMPWPDPKGSPKPGDNALSGTGGLDSIDLQLSGGVGGNPFNPFVMPFPGSAVPPQQQHHQPPQVPQMQVNHQGGMWAGPNGPIHNGNMVNNMMPPQLGHVGNPFAGPMPTSPPNMDMVNQQPPPNFMNNRNPFASSGPNQFGPGPPPQYGPGPGFNGPNFGPMGPNGPMHPGGPMGPGPMGPGPMGPGPLMNVPMPLMNGPGPRNSGNNNRGGGGNWRPAGSNFSDHNNSGGGGGGNWRPAGSGQNRNDWVTGGGGGGGVCKAFMRGHCRLGKSCKYIHPNKSKRI